MENTKKPIAPVYQPNKPATPDSKPTPAKAAVNPSRDNGGNFDTDGNFEGNTKK